MSAIATITIDDGAATPVARPFEPDDVNSQLATWLYKPTGPLIGYNQLTLSVRKSASATTVVGKIVLPTLETISGDAGGYDPVPKLAYNCIGKFEFVLPTRCTEAERNDILALLTNLLADNQVVDAVIDYSKPY